MALEPLEKFGWGARIRTWEWRNQNPLPYHLATPHRHGAGLHSRRFHRWQPDVRVRLAAAPRQCVSPGANQTTSPGRIRSAKRGPSPRVWLGAARGRADRGERLLRTVGPAFAADTVLAQTAQVFRATLGAHRA